MVTDTHTHTHTHTDKRYPAWLYKPKLPGLKIDSAKIRVRRRTCQVCVLSICTRVFLGNVICKLSHSRLVHVYICVHMYTGRSLTIPVSFIFSARVGYNDKAVTWKSHFWRILSGLITCLSWNVDYTNNQLFCLIAMLCAICGFGYARKA